MRAWWIVDLPDNYDFFYGLPPKTYMPPWRSRWWNKSRRSVKAKKHQIDSFKNIGFNKFFYSITYVKLRNAMRACFVTQIYVNSGLKFEIHKVLSIQILQMEWFVLALSGLYQKGSKSVATSVFMKIYVERLLYKFHHLELKRKHIECVTRKNIY